ncbi:type VII secretion target [Kitasatospora sp. NPDC006697]|uniref:type VII secretion target n=1 Tax=Kitasatospora sp. NPDC006697 TaxID=3364020 RepID=UPI003680FF4A
MGEQPTGGAGTGFTVNHDTLTTAADRLKAAADDLAAVSGSLASPPAFGADNYGDYGAADAARDFVAAWQDELQLNHDALALLADKVRQSAANYQAGDAKVAAGLGAPGGHPS